jgi:hypothetical protein
VVVVEAFLVAVAAVVMAEVEAARAEIASDVVGVDRTGVVTAVGMVTGVGVAMLRRRIR